MVNVILTGNRPINANTVLTCVWSTKLKANFYSHRKAKLLNSTEKVQYFEQCTQS